MNTSSASRRSLPILLLLFVGSGCAALIYEIVWLQLLSLVIGSSAVSLGVLLGTFMGGMCIGSLFMSKYISRTLHPLKVYAYLEFGIGAIGLLVLFGMPLVGDLYTSIAGGGIFTRAIFAGVCLLPPTILMGATLPAIARWVETTPEGVSWLGFFYGGNIAGAVIGSLLACFYLLRVFDMATATYVALAINIVVALLALLTAKLTPFEAPAESSAKAEAAPGATAVYITIALSGLTALAAEVLWTRLLSLTFGATTYTFSLILAVFLIGLGIGSSVGSGMARTLARPRVALGWCQMLLCGGIAWAAYMLTESLPYWPINPSINTDSVCGYPGCGVYYNFQLDMVRCLWVVLPSAILWGMSFPLALASVASKGQDPAKLVGRVYAANTVGAIVGSLMASLVITQSIGSQHGQQILIAICAGAALLLLAPVVAGGEGEKGKLNIAAAALLVAATGGAAFLVRSVHDVPPLLVAYGRYAATWAGQTNVIYKGEGLNAFVAVSEMPNGVRNYHNAGKVQASSEPQDMRLQRMLGHLTTLVPTQAKRVVVIGCGAGVTAGAVSISPRLEKETIAEIEKIVPYSVDEYFGAHNYNVIKNPKVNVHIDDARHYILTSKEKIDALTSDPLDPWVKGAATLYTQEFFEIVKKHLNPGGVVTLFVQLYESNEAAVKSEIATFFAAFPNGMVFGNTQQGKGYDLVLLGQVEPTKIDLDEMEQRLASPQYAQTAQSLREVGFNSAVELFATYAGSAKDLEPWLKDAQINHDRNLRLQYLAGMGLNLYQSDRIYADMLPYSRYPEGMFTGSPALIQQLREAMARAQGR
jgi:spermidine synthase